MNYSESYAQNYSEPYTSNYSESYASNYSEPYASNYSEPYAQNYSEPYASTYTTYDTYSPATTYTTYDAYSPGYSSYGYDYGYSYPSYGYSGYSYVNPGYSYVSYTSPTVVTTPSTTYVQTTPSITYSPTTITDSGNTTSTNTSTYTSTTNLNYTSTVDSHNVTNIDSHNDSHNVTTVSQATPQYTAGYAPSYYYPSYYPSYYGGSSYFYPYTYASAPSCSITATAVADGKTILTWYSTNATSAYISPSVGGVSPSGSTSLYPYGNTLYTMTVSGAGGSATCQTTAHATAVSYTAAAVAATVSTAPYVALTQIPYTGFDYGPMGDALYWATLLAFAVAAAYLAVYYVPALVRAHTVPAIAMKRELAPAMVAVQKDEAPVAAPAPVSNRFGTRDVMSAVPSKNGHAPRIVIARE